MTILNIFENNPTRKDLKILSLEQCCGAENISFSSDSGSAEPQNRIAAPAPASKYIDSYLLWLKYLYFFTWIDAWYQNRITIVPVPVAVIIYKNFSSHHVFDTQKGVGAAIRNFGSGSRR